MMIDRDLANMAAPADVARATMTIIDAVQAMPPHIQVHAAAAVFLLLADRFHENPQEAFARTKHLMNHADGRRPEFRAAAAYLENEI